MHVMQETLRKDCRAVCESSPGIDGKNRTRRGLVVPIAMQFSPCRCPGNPPGGTGIILDFAFIGKNCLLSGIAQFIAVSVLKINLIFKFYTFLIIQINIVLHYCVLRISDSLIGGPAAHRLKPPLAFICRRT